MDAKALYWTGALINMVIVVGSGGLGVWYVRRGEVAKHRRCMLLSASLVLAFLVSYGVKLSFLGRENLAVWSNLYIQTLRFHETCVLVMVAGGGFALWRAWQMRKSRNVTADSDAPFARPEVRKYHRYSGWTALGASVLGVLSAFVVLIGMYQRLGH